MSSLLFMPHKANRPPIIPSVAKQSIKGIVTLYGPPNSGKTAALQYLYTLLSGLNPPLRTNGKASKDFRAAFVYKGAVILLSTVGDSTKDVSDNWNWFLSLGKRSLNLKGNSRCRPCVCLGEETIPSKIILISPTRLGGPTYKEQERYIQALKPTVSTINFIHKEVAPNLFSGLLSQMNSQAAQFIKTIIDSII